MSQKPLKIFLAIAGIALAVLILNSLPTTIVKTTKTPVETVSGADFYFLEGFSDLLEDDFETMLEDRGVPAEDYAENLGEYFTKDELYELEAKATLAEVFEETWLLATPQDLEALRQIFQLDADYDFDAYDHTQVRPAEYVNLADLLTEYYHTINTVEDYDVVE